MARKRIIPKRIGKLRVPKRLRRFGDAALRDPRVAEAAGGLLLALAASAAARRGTPGASFLRDLLGARGTARDGAKEGAKEGDRAGGAHEAGAGLHAAAIAGRVVEEVLSALGKRGRAARPDTRPDKGPRDAKAEEPSAEPEEGGGEEGRVH